MQTALVAQCRSWGHKSFKFLILPQGSRLLPSEGERERLEVDGY